MWLRHLPLSDQQILALFPFVDVAMNVLSSSTDAIEGATDFLLEYTSTLPSTDTKMGLVCLREKEKERQTDRQTERERMNGLE